MTPFIALNGLRGPTDAAADRVVSAHELAPIAGVDLATYARVSRGIAAYGYDATMLPLVAADLGISAEDWAAARAGWAARIQTERAVGAAFNECYFATDLDTPTIPATPDHAA